MPKRCRHHNSLLICVLCSEPVDVRTAKTDAYGRAVHEECIVQKMVSDGRAKTPKLPPHLVQRNSEKCCSVCGAIFKPDGEVSILKAFVAHVRKDHIPAPAVTISKPKSA